jgi:hypothetical protein
MDIIEKLEIVRNRDDGSINFDFDVLKEAAEEIKILREELAIAEKFVCSNKELCKKYNTALCERYVSVKDGKKKKEACHVSEDK